MEEKELNLQMTRSLLHMESGVHAPHQAPRRSLAHSQAPTYKSQNFSLVFILLFKDLKT